MTVFMKTWTKKKSKLGIKKAPNLYYIMVLYVIWYTDCNGIKIRCIEYAHLGHNPKWSPKINDFCVCLKLSLG